MSSCVICCSAADELVGGPVLLLTIAATVRLHETFAAIIENLSICALGSTASGTLLFGLLHLVCLGAIAY